MTSDSRDCATIVRSVRNAPWAQLGLAVSTNHRGMRRCLGVLKRRGRCDALVVATFLHDNDSSRLATVKTRVWPPAGRRLTVDDRGPGAATAARTVLVRVAQDTDPYIRQLAADNPNTPGGVLTVLAVDDNEDVRKLVANNLSTPGGVLAALAGDTHEDVRELVADNPNTGTNELKKLANDSMRSVAQIARRRLGLSAAHLLT